jgi:hypothetical protein
MKGEGGRWKEEEEVRRDEVKIKKKRSWSYPTWLEYNIAKDAAFCLYCYLFKSKRGVDSFVGDRFSNWKKKERFDLHIGKSNSSHNAAWIKCENLMNEK